MSFLPLNINQLQTSLIGIGKPLKIMKFRKSNIIDFKKDNLFEKRIDPPTEQYETIILIIISAIIFVTFVAIYDFIKGLINNYYSKKSLNDPNSYNTSEDIQRTIIANEHSLMSNFIFVLVCIIIAVILVPILESKISNG